MTRQMQYLVGGGSLVAILIGWLIATPGYQGTDFSSESDLEFTESADAVEKSTLDAALEEIIARQMFSAPQRAEPEPEVKPAPKPQSKPQPTRPPPPSGLDRFQLVALIRVAGSPPEAILIDRGNDGAEMLTATVGKKLGDSDVTLARIDGNRVLIEIDETKQRWLDLFPRAASASDTMTSTLASLSG